MKRIKFRKDSETPFNTKDTLVQLLSVNPQGGNIEDMIKKVELKKRIEAVNLDDEDAGFNFKDSEYDMIKALYKSNSFPVNNEFFIQVWNDINEYTSVTETKEKEPAQDANAKA